ncbi:partial microcystin synthetase protein McyA, partial [Anaerolineae bacterium]
MTTTLWPNNMEDAYPLSRLQAGMLFHSAYSPETDIAVYHDIFSFHLRAVFDLAALQRAVNQIVLRHAVLRTSFDLTNFSQPLQLVHNVVHVPVHVEDLRALTPVEQEAALNVWMQNEKRQPFDWTQPPLLRFQVHRRSEETFEFTVSFHHAILDGWSVASMLTELFQIYLSQLGQAVPPLKLAPQVTFRDFVALERKVIATEEPRRYWSEKLQDSTALLLPRWELGRPKDNSRQVLQHEVLLPVEVSTNLRRLAQSAGVPLKSVLLAAHLWVLSRLGNQDDVLTGLVSHGRPEEADGERVLGLFLNTLPFRLKLSGGTWHDLVRETYRVEQDMLPFRLYPLAEIQKLRGGQPLFETAFNFIHFHVYQSLGEFAAVQQLGGRLYEETNFTLLANFSQDVHSPQVHLTLMYDNTILSVAQVAALGGYYARTLTAMAEHPHQPYTAAALLSTAERQQLVTTWNATH